METLSTTNFDKLEKLLQTKSFSELSVVEKERVTTLVSEEEYASMSMLYNALSIPKHTIDIEPQQNTKLRLNKALNARFHRLSLFQLKMPVYQSVAAAVLFFLVGFGVNFKQPSDPKVIHDTVQVIKYVTQTGQPKIMASETAHKQTKKKVKRMISLPEQEPELTAQVENAVTTSESNPELIRQQEIAMTNINHVLNERTGSSMGGDSVIKRMLVTVY